MGCQLEKYSTQQLHEKQKVCQILDIHTHHLNKTPLEVLPTFAHNPFSGTFT